MVVKKDVLLRRTNIKKYSTIGPIAHWTCLVFGSPLFTTRIISEPEKWLPGLESRSYHYTQCPDEHVALGMTSCTRSGFRNSTEFLKLDAAKILL